MATRGLFKGAPPLGRRLLRMRRTRRELLAAGRRLFAEKGLYDSRIEDLARQAGIAKGTLYLYFANKEELVEAVAANGLNELLGQVHHAAQDADSREDAVERVAAAHLAFFEENPDLMRILHQVRGLLKFDDVESRALRGVLERYLKGLAHVLALQGGARPARGVSQLDSAKLLFGAVSGITSVQASLGSAASRRAEAHATLRALVGLVTAYEASGRGPVENRRARGKAGSVAHAAAGGRRSKRRSPRA